MGAKTRREYWLKSREEISTSVNFQIMSIYELLPIEIARNMMKRTALKMFGSSAVTQNRASIAILVE